MIHIFGGGCGEHLVWPGIVSMWSGILIWVKSTLQVDADNDV